MIEEYFLALALFCLGLWGLLLRRNLVSTLVCFLVIQASVFFSFALLAKTFHDSLGQAAVMYGVLLGLIWSTVSLCLIIFLYKKTNTLRTDHIDLVV